MFLSKLLTRTKAVFQDLYLSMGWLLALPLLFYAFLPVPVQAQDLLSFAVFENVRTLPQLLDFLLVIITRVAGPIAVILIIIGGMQAMFGGKEESIKAGVQKIIGAAVGLGIILMANSIENLIQATFFEGDVNVGFLINVLEVLVIRNLTLLAVAMATIAMIVGGYKDFLSAFDAKTSGTEAVRSALFGLSIIFLAGGLAQIIGGAINPEESNIIISLENLIGSIDSVLEAVIGLMTVLGVVVSILVITKGGYDYFLSAFSDKVNALETIQKGVTGLAITLVSGFLAVTIFDLFDRVDNTSNIFNLTNLPAQAEAILEPLVLNAISFLVAMASIVAVCVIIYGGYVYFASAVAEQKKKGSEIITNGVLGLIVIILAGPIVNFIPSVIRTTYQNDNTEVTFSLEAEPLLNLVRELLVGFIIPLAGLVTVFFFVYGGYLWLSARGDGEQVKKARTAITNALIGLIIILLATTVVGLIIFFFRPDEFVEPGEGLQGPSVTETRDRNLPISDEDFINEGVIG